MATARENQKMGSLRCESQAQLPEGAYKRLMILAQVPPGLAAAARSYLTAFGHPVPDEILEMYAGRPGPLILEIRQAVTLQRPVKAWLSKSSVGPARSLDSA